MHDALPLVHPGCGDPVPGGGESAEHRRSGPADRRMRGNCSRFVDRNDVVVGIQNRHALDIDGGVLQRRGRLGQPHLQQGAGDEPIGLSGRHAIQLDRALFGEGSRSGPRQSQQAGQSGVNTHSRQSIRNGH
ncbi:Uncharacterised protein [Mycobacterium tuberculosis]|nr:Uncharacterised protein [Mycobacterium tuberculosis]